MHYYSSLPVLSCAVGISAKANIGVVVGLPPILIFVTADYWPWIRISLKILLKYLTTFCAIYCYMGA